MAKKITDSIKTELISNSIKVIFDINLLGEITLIGGDSGVGKSFFFDTINYECLLGNNGRENIECFNTLNIKSDELYNKIGSLHNKLIIIDNADILLNRWDTANYLRGSDNQFMIFGRRMDFYGVPRSHQATMIRNGSTIALEY